MPRALVTPEYPVPNSLRKFESELYDFNSLSHIIPLEFDVKLNVLTSLKIFTPA